MEQTQNAQNTIGGWIIILLGLAVIFWGIYSSYMIFSGKNPPPEVFKNPIVFRGPESSQNDVQKTGSKESSSKIDVAKLQNMNPEDLQKLQEEQQKEMQAAIAQSLTSQIDKMIPADLMTKIMNLTSWSFFAFILIYAGAKISGIGVKLLKN